MKNLKRFLLGVLFATFIFATCGMSVFAASSTTKTLKQNAWFTQKNNGKETYNKITVPNDGYITITVENMGTNSVWVDLYDKNKKYIAEPIWGNNKKMTVKYPISKGTYYLRGDAWDNYRYKWSFTKAVNKTNYTASKALALNAKKEVIVVNTPMNSYDRWYKIKLTRKQSINYWVTGSNGVYFYDSDFEQLDTLYDDEEQCYYTRKLLPKGTYYVRLASSYYFYSGNKATMTTFKWK